MGVQVGLVIGGGNFWRGVKNGSGKLQRSHADAMGMLATVMNAIAVADALEQIPKEKRPFACVGCKSCEQVCPQQIQISEIMKSLS
jgi:uridylate kinase